jgi:uncharacterized membrane protein YgcG
MNDMMIMTNKKSSLILFLALLLITISPSFGQKVASYQSRWQGEIAGLEGKPLIDLMQVHQKTQFLYLISNDEKFLYIDLLINDRAAIQKSMRYGLTTWLNAEGKTKKGMGIEFPAAPEGNGEPAFRRDKGGDRRDMMMAMLAQKNREMVLVGFGSKDERILIDPTIDPVFDGQIMPVENDGGLLIRLVMPLEKIGRGQADTFSQPFSLGFETGYLDVTGQGMPSGGGMQDGGMHGGGGRYGGGMPGGGPPSGMAPGEGQTAAGDQQKQPDINQLASPSKMWIKEVKLAPQP